MRVYKSSIMRVLFSITVQVNISIKKKDIICTYMQCINWTGLWIAMTQDHNYDCDAERGDKEKINKNFFDTAYARL